MVTSFPSMDDIVKEICSHGNDAIILKIDVDRAFHNLCVDPVDEVIPMSLRLHCLGIKSMQIKANTNPGPDMCLQLQRRVSPLYPDTGLQSLLRRPILIKTHLNTIHLL